MYFYEINFIAPSQVVSECRKYRAMTVFKNYYNLLLLQAVLECPISVKIPFLDAYTQHNKMKSYKKLLNFDIMLEIKSKKYTK